MFKIGDYVEISIEKFFYGDIGIIKEIHNRGASIIMLNKQFSAAVFVYYHEMRVMTEEEIFIWTMEN
jgi:hypothetical protein